MDNKKNLNHFLELLFLYTELKKEEERNIWNDSSSSSLVVVSYVLLYTGNGNTKNKTHRHHQPGGPARRKVGHSIDSRLFLHSAATEWQHQAVTGTLVTIQGPAFIFSSILVSTTWINHLLHVQQVVYNPTFCNNNLEFMLNVFHVKNFPLFKSLFWRRLPDTCLYGGSKPPK